MGSRAADQDFDEEITDTFSELDPLPEHCGYRDEGCELNESCLHCPFEECVLDKPGGKQRRKKEERSAEIARLFSEENKTIQELAEMFGISKRTVQRDLKAALHGRKQENNDERSI